MRKSTMPSCSLSNVPSSIYFLHQRTLLLPIVDRGFTEAGRFSINKEELNCSPECIVFAHFSDSDSQRLLVITGFPVSSAFSHIFGGWQEVHFVQCG